jgi:hypothetical protein
MLQQKVVNLKFGGLRRLCAVFFVKADNLSADAEKRA